MRARDWLWIAIVAFIVILGLSTLGRSVDRRQDFREWCAGEGGHANRDATECRSGDGEIILRRS